MQYLPTRPVSHVVAARGLSPWASRPLQASTGEPTIQLWTTSVQKIRTSPGVPIISYTDLVHRVAALGSVNLRYCLFFRGQGEDFKDKKDQTVIYPTILRPERHGGRVTRHLLDRRFDDLANGVQRLREARVVNTRASDMDLSFLDHYFMAILQHYELRWTPLIDLTQSLRVAASLALMGTPTGFLYVAGLPFPYAAVSFFFDVDIIILKLSSICPPEARRPHHQEGYLVGRVSVARDKQAGDNLARRLVAKYELDNSEGNFWAEPERPIDRDALFPGDDKFGDRLRDALGA